MLRHQKIKESRFHRKNGRHRYCGWGTEGEAEGIDVAALGGVDESAEVGRDVAVKIGPGLSFHLVEEPLIVLLIIHQTVAPPRNGHLSRLAVRLSPLASRRSPRGLPLETQQPLVKKGFQIPPPGLLSTRGWTILARGGLIEPRRSTSRDGTRLTNPDNSSIFLHHVEILLKIFRFLILLVMMHARIYQRHSLKLFLNALYVSSMFSSLDLKMSFCLHP